MNDINGKQSPSISSAQSLSVSLGMEVGMLLGLGMIGIVLHARLRLGLGIPGHHGLIFMAFMMAGRINSKLDWASSISSLGVATLLFFPFLGFKDPFMSMTYLLPGIIVDLLFRSTLLRGKFWYLALIAGLAYMSIPVSRLIINIFTGFPYLSFRHGLVFPILSHFLFGAGGGLLALGVTRILRRN